ncbi:poly(3-hydroxyalkanoate) depolymerase [Bradyrhizobium diazoefficiens USDA 110]|uniref:Poly(3-hydroxyalkanoate) depolymerase n=1 Tax=Bradyrhizobium diazoefficiens (strain JCM 10833 / BCRC 13528 / IAM 13628 / NBRC 14792 / USDA 110) TaxID=224911 RepID=Q89VZ4_BRADU|nr:esterase [Bradyrhizobium diazoefficiens]QBP26945.1 esterase [Bradyrhizobium diazoefficiens]BAC46164.1 poly(3-hydroxyalkanoate) depolymerase [Bradyrhizobium diazoefficiens USDA 110]
MDVERRLPGVAVSLARNIDLLRRLPKVDGLRFADFGRSADAPGPLQEVADFGDNPGNLRMFAFAPAQLQMPRALVVVLHGCGQTAAAYDLGAGWSTLARHYGFALLMPEQQRVNNGNTCFNWFNPEDTARDSGEARSIREMIAHMVKTHRIDPRRVFITGLSAGGGMTSVMLATYPEVFAAGAVIAGLPYGIASNLREALDGMFHSPARPARELGDLVRNASDYRGPWPKMSVWHGSADRTVNPGNANEIVKQWLDLHDLPDVPMAETNVDGYPRQAWWNKDGETLVESYAITDMAHGTPLGLADNDQRYGVEGAFLIEAGISSSYHIAKFFGLTGWIPDAAKKKAEAKPGAPKPALTPAPHLARSIRDAVAEPPAEPKREDARGFDLGQIITRALTAAGLMK